MYVLMTGGSYDGTPLHYAAEFGHLHMYVLKPDLYTLTLLAGLTINSIVQQSRHCTPAEKFTLEEL